MGRGGVFELRNPERRGAQAVLKIMVEEGSKKKTCLPSAGGVDFSWNNPLPFSWYRLFIARKFMSSQRTIFFSLAMM